ncbi:MAG: AAA family ATPase, partial [Planctomycetota bacterium]
MARNWADAFLSNRQQDATEMDDPSMESHDDPSDTQSAQTDAETITGPPSDRADELAWLILNGGDTNLQIVSVNPDTRLESMVGAHRRIQSGRMSIQYHHWMRRMETFCRDQVPRYHALQEAKQEIVAASRASMRLDEFRARVLTSFVRNRLLDEVYLPMIGDNLAKQIGAAGDNRRTDSSGLLLLISPPGYGKTTLMEYVASRLGMVFAKINGPAIGHDVKSLDPAEAPNAAAREEIQRLNLALEMGDNVMLYVDDIQHTH